MSDTAVKSRDGVEIEEKPILAVCGDTGLKETGGYINEEFHRNLRGDKALRVYKEMGHNESNVAASKFVIEMLIRNTPRTVKPNDSGHPLAQQAADHVRECLHDMESTLQEALSEAATAIDYGFSYLEVTMKIRKGENREPRLNSQYNDGRWGWRDWSPRAQESRHRWEYSKDNRLLGMWQTVDRSMPDMFIPVDRALHFRFRGSKQNPEGLSFYRPAYVSYYFCTKHRTIEGIVHERNGAGLPVMELPERLMSADANDDELAARAVYEAMVKKVRFDEQGGLVIPTELNDDGKPSGYRFRLVAASGRSLLDGDPIIRRYQNEMLKVFMTQFLAFGTQQVGSHALSSDMTSMLGFAVGAVNKNMDETINRSAIPRLMRLEGIPREAWPKIESGDVERSSLTEAAGFISALIGVGAMEPGKDIDDWGRKQIGLEPREDSLNFAEFVNAGNPPEIQTGDETSSESTAEEPTITVPGQETAPEVSLNGAQIASLLEVLNGVASGQLPRANGLEIIQTAFQLDANKAERLMGEIGRTFFVSSDTGGDSLPTMTGGMQQQQLNFSPTVEKEEEEEEIPDEMLDLTQAAELLGMTRNSVMNNLKRGRLPGRKIGNQVRIRRRDLIKFLGGGF